MPDTTEFWAQCLREALLDPVTAGQVEAGPGGRAGFFLNLLSLPSYGRYQHSDEDMLAAHDGTCTCGWPAAPSRCPRTTRTRLLRSAPDGDTTYLILDALAARPWVRFLLTFGPGVLASTEDQAPAGI